MNIRSTIVFLSIALCVTATFFTTAMAADAPLIPVTPEPHKSAVKMLNNYREIFPEVIKMLEGAEDEILFNVHMLGGTWEHGTYLGDHKSGIGNTIMGILTEKHNKGVRVRIIAPPMHLHNDLFDDLLVQAEYVGSIIERGKRDSTQYYEEQDNKRLVAIQNGLEPVEGGFSTNYYVAQYHDFEIKDMLQLLISNTNVLSGPAKWKFDNNNILIVDGKEAMIGTCDFAELVKNNPTVAFRIAGSAIKELKAVFTNNWVYALQDVMANADYSDKAYSVFTGKRHIHKFPDTVIEHLDERMDEAKKLALYDEQIINEHYKKRLAENWLNAEINLTHSSPYLANTRSRIIEKLASTKPGDKVMIGMQVLTDSDCINAILDTHHRGVDIRVLLDPNISVHRVDGYGVPNVIALLDLLLAEVPTKEYIPFNRRIEYHMNLLFIKRANGSAEFAMGSTNWTPGALDSNFDLFAFFKNCPKLAYAVEAGFEQCWAKETRDPVLPTVIGDLDEVGDYVTKERIITLKEKITGFFDILGMALGQGFGKEH